MKISLNSFEQQIDDVILKRGLDYFKKGFVSAPEEITAGEYEATVSGTEDYEVRLKIRNNTVESYSCTCPYDLGPVCKHVTAVIFSLMQEELGLQPAKRKKKAGTTVTRKKTVAEQVSELTEKLSAGELKNFIREECESDSAFRQMFIARFAHLVQGESKELYARQVKTVLRKAAGRERFIDWSAARFVGKAVYDLMTTAEKHFENKNFRSAALISMAVMEEMVEALQYSDDSNADIGGPMEIAFELLHKISKETISEETRQMLFDYCLTSFEKKTFNGWDWHLGVLHLASQICSGESESGKLQRLLEHTAFSEYHKQQAQEIEHELIRKTKGEAEAEKFLVQHISNPAFRTAAIEKAIREKRFDAAIALADDGVKSDRKNKPGLANEWQDWLLRIAILQRDKEKVIAYSRLLFIDSIREKEEYYRLMKENVVADQWKDFVEELIRDIVKRNSWLDMSTLSNIFIKEEWWSRLLDLVSKNPSLSTIEHYEKYLAKDYSARLADLYEKEITELMRTSMGRNHYQNACRFIRRMIKLGAKEKAEALIEKFRKEYPQRKALMEELDRI